MLTAISIGVTFAYRLPKGFERITVHTEISWIMEISTGTVLLRGLLQRPSEVGRSSV